MAEFWEFIAPETIKSNVDGIIQKVVDSLGIATKDDIKALDKRLQKVEASIPLRKKPGRPPGSKNKKKASGKKAVKK